MILFEESINLNAIGILGAALVILGILGHVSMFVAILGGVIVGVSTYSMNKFHEAMSIIAYSLGYQTSIMIEEEEHEEE